MATETVGRGRPKSEKSVRARVEAAFAKLGLAATTPEVKKALKRYRNIDVTSKSVDVVISQTKTRLLKESGVRVVKKVGRPSTTQIEKREAAVAKLAA